MITFIKIGGGVIKSWIEGTHNVTLTAHFNPGIWHLSKTKMKCDETPVFTMDIYGIFDEDFKTVFLFRAT